MTAVDPQAQPIPGVRGGRGDALLSLLRRAYYRAERGYNWIARRPEWLLVSSFLLVLLAVSIYVRTRQVGGQFWMDEAITVGIASHPLTQIPHIMRMDGSPPLFYLLLHVWIRMLGDSSTATHWLSVIFGAATIPVGYWGARKILNRRAAGFAALLFATNAFLTGYSQETRMYALMVLLGLLATIGFVAGFVYRRRAYLALFVVGQVLMMYTHAWGLFFGASSFICMVMLYWISDESERVHYVRDAIYVYIAVAILYAPWLPTFLFQSIHTAAPWDSRPRFGLPVQIGQGIMGGDSIAIATFAITVYGCWSLLGRSGRRTREARVMFMLFGLPALTFAFAWCASQITPAWVVRYFAPTVGPVLLLLALGLARARGLGVLALLLACTALLHPATFAPPNKSDMRQISGEVANRMHPGDLVIVGQPEQTPLAYYYLPAGLRYANTIGPVADPTFMNWVNALTRYKDAKPDRVLPPLLNSLRVGQRVLYIKPLTEGNANWTAPWTQLIRLRSAQWGQILADDKQFKPVAWSPQYFPGACCVADSAALYQKVS
jgi:hypothetical protein